MFNQGNVGSEQLGHLGLVAATIRELGIIERIDARLELNQKKGGLVSYGSRVAAMIMNGLGFMNSRLYLTPHFFQDKPIGHLLGADIVAEHLNDDSLGRCLDKIAEYGVSKLYSELAFEIAKEKNLLSQRLHLDSTSFVLYGRYEGEEESLADIAHPDYGYSKANRADLKQVMLSLVQGGAANIPLWMEALDGNSSDKTSFQLKEAKALLNKPSCELAWEVFDDNYRGSIKEVVVYGIPQRWVLIESQHAIEREQKTFQRQLDKKSEELIKALWHLGNQVFQCPADAKSALRPLVKSLKYHQIHYDIVPIERHPGKGRPAPGAEKVVIGYQIQAHLSTCLELVRAKKETLGRFILATNQCDYSLLNNHAMLKQYKEQSCVEIYQSYCLHKYKI